MFYIKSIDIHIFLLKLISYFIICHAFLNLTIGSIESANIILESPKQNANVNIVLYIQHTNTYICT